MKDFDNYWKPKLRNPMVIAVTVLLAGIAVSAFAWASTANTWKQAPELATVPSYYPGAGAAFEAQLDQAIDSLGPRLKWEHDNAWRFTTYKYLFWTGALVAVGGALGALLLARRRYVAAREERLVEIIRAGTSRQEQASQ